MEKSTPFEHPEDLDSMILETSNTSSDKKKVPLNPKKRKYVTQESLPTTKKETSKGKSKTSNQNTQTTKLSKTSDQVMNIIFFFELKIFQGSITKGGVSFPFWNEYTKEMSLKLLLHTETDCVDMDLNLLNSSSRKLAQVTVIN